MSSRLHLLGATVLLLGSSCGSPDDAPSKPKASATPGAPTQPSAPKASSDPKVPSGELVFTPQSGWTVEKPTSTMRKAQYVLPRAEGDSDDGSVVAFYFGSAGGGGREANLTRWAMQFAQPDGSDSAAKMKTADRTVNGLKVTDVDLSGNYIAETTPGSGERLNKENWRMLATIVEAPAGAYYVKFVGPAKTVDRWEASYRAFVDSLKAAP